MWSAPKTNWKPTDYFTYRDFNRIAGNMEFVRAKIEDVIGENTEEYQELSMNKVVNSKPYASEFNKMWDNLVLLDSLFCEEGVKRNTYNGNGKTTAFEDFNRIEQYLLEYHDWLQQIKEDDTRPSISIEVNTDTWVNMPSWHFEAIISDGGNALSHIVLTFNDKKFVYEDPGSPITLEDEFVLKEGINKFKIKAFDDSNFPRIDTFTMKYDADAPALSVTSASGYINSSSYTLKGKAVDTVSGLSEVTIDGTKVTVASDGTFSKTFTVNGTKTFKVVAKDIAGNSRTVNHTVTLENTNPSLSITSASGYIASTTYTLSGVASDSQSGIASVTIDGVAVSVNSGGGFSKTFTVTGSKTFTVVAKDKAGHTTTATHSVTYDNSAHAATLTTSLITNIKYSSDSWASYQEAGSDSGSVVGNFYCSRERRSKCTGNGVSVSVSASYSGDIYLPALPNWNKIRKVVISRYGQGSQTFNPNGTQTTLSFSDSASASTTEHQVGDYADAGCTAGINSLTYYYA